MSGNKRKRVPRMASLHTSGKRIVSAGAVIALIAWIIVFNEVSPADCKQNSADTLAQFSAGVADVVKTVTPAVVNISSTRIVRQKGESIPGPFFSDPFFKRFFGDQFPQQLPPRERREQSLGSGVLVSPDGYIVTNNHVVAQAQEIRVLMSDRREFTGRMVGTDPKTDLAVIKIDGTNLPSAAWGDSDRLLVGETAIAVGNPFGLSQTVTMGIVSAVGRANVGIADYEDFIQTDAAINPGNSGGALVNVKGELIGINTAIFSQSGGYMGIGFAIPSNMVKSVMDQLVKGGKVVRGWLGVSSQEMTPELARQFGLKEVRGTLVTEIETGSPAAKAGIARGDVIISYDGRPVKDLGHLRNQVAATRIGKKVSLTVMRDGKELAMDVVIVELPVRYAAPQKEREAGENVLSGMAVQDMTSNIRRQLEIPKEVNGVVVSSVRQDSALATAGIEEGDVVEEVNRQPVRNLAEFTRAARKVKADEGVLLLVFRAGNHIYVTVSP